jgi:hypothetical protein
VGGLVTDGCRGGRGGEGGGPAVVRRGRDGAALTTGGGWWVVPRGGGHRGGRRATGARVTHYPYRAMGHVIGGPYNKHEKLRRHDPCMLVGSSLTRRVPLLVVVSTRTLLLGHR